MMRKRPLHPSSFSLHTSSFAPKARIHIFWQKRIRQDDASTPWWFPAKTDGGAIRADRIVLPIPPGTRWSDEMPIVLPNAFCQLPNEEPKKPRRVSVRQPAPEIRKPRPVVRFGSPSMTPPVPVEAPKEVEPPKVRMKRPKVKTDPKLVSAARELRDRWLERVNDDPAAIVGRGKYDVSRAIGDRAGPLPVLEAA